MAAKDINDAFDGVKETGSVDVPAPQVIRRPGENWSMFTLRKLFARKNVENLINSTEDTGMKRRLNAIHLTGIGVGCIVGTGIFVYSGLVAREDAGPAVVLSFAIAGFVATLAALCYSEIASMIPIAGSAYSYTYTTMGEFVSWIVGWVLILEYLVGSAAVGVGWSAYLMRFFGDAFGWHPPLGLTKAFVSWNEKTSSFELTGYYFNIPAVVVIMTCTLLLILSSRESATATVIAVVIKLTVILLFIFACAGDVDVANYNPFVPSADPNVSGRYGGMGVLKGASIVFFCYTGFDSVSTAAQEAKNPAKDMPIGIIGSLVISTVLYIAVCLVLVGIVPYNIIDTESPITFATSYVNKNWLSIAIGLSAVLGMITAAIVTMMAQARIFYAMSRDGLLPRFFGRVHRKFGTPWVSQLIVGCLSSLLAAIFPIDLLGTLSGMGTLFGFFLVCLGVMILRIRRPDLPRPFRVPLGPYVIPLLGALFSIALVFTSPPSSLARLFIWLGIGILVYICYGFRNSRVNHPEKFIGNDFEKIIREH